MGLWLRASHRDDDDAWVDTEVTGWDLLGHTDWLTAWNEPGPDGLKLSDAVEMPRRTLKLRERKGRRMSNALRIKMPMTRGAQRFREAVQQLKRCKLPLSTLRVVAEKM